MRSVLYWLGCVTFALICVTAAATPQPAAASVATVDGMGVSPSGNPARSIILGIGILALAYTYQRVWLNFSRKH